MSLETITIKLDDYNKMKKENEELKEENDKLQEENATWLKYQEED